MNKVQSFQFQSFERINDDKTTNDRNCSVINGLQNCNALNKLRHVFKSDRKTKFKILDVPSVMTFNGSNKRFVAITFAVMTQNSLLVIAQCYKTHSRAIQCVDRFLSLTRCKTSFLFTRNRSRSSSRQRFLS